MQAIHTKYISATNTRGARIKAYNATHPRGVLVGIDYSLNQEQRHFVDAHAFIKKYLSYAPDHKTMAYGSSADDKGYTFCFLSSTVTMED